MEGLAGAATVVGGFLATYGSAIAIGALVGATVGALSAAVTGGSVWKGMLFGAIGGAVTAGVGAYMSGTAAGTAAGAGATIEAGTGSLATDVGAAAGTGAGSNVGAVVVQKAGEEVVKEVVKETTMSSFLKGLGSEFTKQLGGEVIKGMATAYMQGEAMDENFKNELAYAQEKAKLEMQLLEKKAELGSGEFASVEDPRLAIANLEKQSRDDQLTESRRQYNLDRSDRLSSEDELRTAKEERQALFSVGSQRQGVNESETTGGMSILEARQEQGLAAEGRPLTGDTEEEQTALA